MPRGRMLVNGFALPATSDAAKTPMRASRTYLAAVSAIAGASLLAWLIVRVGPARLLEVWDAARPILPIVAALTGLRYLLQAAGWRLATRAVDRPGWGVTLAGVVAGEAAGYVAGGMLAREPVKFLFVRDRVPARVAVSGAAVERLASIGAGTVIIVTGLTTLAIKRAPTLLLGGLSLVLLTSTLLVLLGRHVRRARVKPEIAEPVNRGGCVEGARSSPRAVLQRVLAPSVDIARELWQERRPAVAAIAALGLAQEAINVTEAYIVLTWIGGTPALATVIAFEGVSRALNMVASFVPGRLGISEATATLAARAVGMSSTYGLSLALVRRGRSLLWAVVGLTLLVVRNAVVAGSVSKRTPAPLHPV